MAKAHGTCIFCGGRGLTKEHLWPKWMRSILAPLAGEMGTATQTLKAPNGIKLNGIWLPVNQHQTRQQGHLFNRRYRIVCKDCNGGWMKNREDRCKSLITGLIAGEAMDISAEQALDLSVWAGCRAAIYDLDHPETSAIPFQDRLFIKENQRLPDTWAVWFGYYEGSRWQVRMHHGGTEVRVGTIGSPPLRLGIPNLQCTTFGAGYWLMHVVSTTDRSHIELFGTPVFDTMQLLWPGTAGFSWPREPVINDEMALEIAKHLVPGG